MMTLESWWSVQEFFNRAYGRMEINYEFNEWFRLRYNNFLNSLINKIEHALRHQRHKNHALTPKQQHKTWNRIVGWFGGGHGVFLHRGGGMQHHGVADILIVNNSLTAVPFILMQASLKALLLCRESKDHYFYYAGQNCDCDRLLTCMECLKQRFIMRCAMWWHQLLITCFWKKLCDGL